MDVNWKKYFFSNKYDEKFYSLCKEFKKIYLKKPYLFNLTYDNCNNYSSNETPKFVNYEDANNFMNINNIYNNCSNNMGYYLFDKNNTKIFISNFIFRKENVEFEKSEINLFSTHGKVKNFTKASALSEDLFNYLSKENHDSVKKLIMLSEIFSKYDIYHCYIEKGDEKVTLLKRPVIFSRPKKFDEHIIRVENRYSKYNNVNAYDVFVIIHENGNSPNSLYAINILKVKNASEYSDAFRKTPCIKNNIFINRLKQTYEPKTYFEMINDIVNESRFSKFSHVEKFNLDNFNNVIEIGLSSSQHGRMDTINILVNNKDNEFSNYHCNFNVGYLRNNASFYIFDYDIEKFREGEIEDISKYISYSRKKLRAIPSNLSANFSIIDGNIDEKRIYFSGYFACEDTKVNLKEFIEKAGDIIPVQINKFILKYVDN